MNPEQFKKEQVQQIAKENERNCDADKKIKDSIKTWEDWKIDEYNNNFAISEHNKKLPYNNERNCDTCKHFNGEIPMSKTNVHCLKCMDFDKWEGREDLIHKPSHYTYSNHEPIDVIKAWNLDFDLGNVVKYIARCEHKGNKLLDLQKALEYLQHEIKYLEDK